MEDVTDEESNILIFFAEVATFILVILILELFVEVEVSDTQDVDKEWEKHGNNGIERQEDSEIIDNAPKHGNQETHGFEDSKEEESFHDKH